MKIQLDTDAKTITVNETVNLKDLINLAKKILPNGEWQEFSLQVDVKKEINTIPIYIDRWPYPNYPWYTNQPCVNDTGENGNLNSGKYNIEFDNGLLYG